VAARASGMQGVEVFSTLPQSSVPLAGPAYLERVRSVARWSEDAGCKGILIYSDNSLVDPWLLGQVVIESTARLIPLVAVQPIYMHPFAAATMVATLGHLHDRQVYLNMIAGGFKNDLVALDDQTPHDRRYDRLVEYTALVQELLQCPAPLTREGEFYSIRGLRLQPPLAAHLQPGIFVSGSSEAGVAAARALGAVAVKYPRPPGESAAEPPPPDLRCGIRVGIVARSQGDDAWAEALRRFPEDRKGQLTHELAMKVSDSVWHKQLSATADATRAKRETYWLHPFETFRTFCPYLVGSYDEVATELARYMALGYRTFILDWPASEEELMHAQEVFARAAAGLSR
jgi:alkanesulfonate monooxygenase